MAQDFSPEEKLLRLIRGEKKHKDDSAVNKPVHKQNSAEKPTTEIRSPKYATAILSSADNERRYLKFINAALMIILIVIIAFFVLNFLNLKPQEPLSISHREDSAVKVEPQTKNNEKKESGQLSQLMPFSGYAETVGKRELFKSYRVEAQKEKPAAAKLEQVQDKIKDLSLIGIISGDNPQAIIEDRRNQKTYFLNKGQTINQMTLEEIFNDRVILNYEGEKLELTL